MENPNGHKTNRHVYPDTEVIDEHKYTKKKKEKFTRGTCFDTAITEQLNSNGLADNVSYLGYKDLKT